MNEGPHLNGYLSGGIAQVDIALRHAIRYDWRLWIARPAIQPMPPPGGATREPSRPRPRSSTASRRRAASGGLLPFLGPAFIASVAYIDPGNFATNIQGGAQFGYTLLWVIVASNLMAMLIQMLSAKLGIATGLNLAEHCRAQLAIRYRSR